MKTEDHARDLRLWARRISKCEEARAIDLPVGISGVGRAGDTVIYDPEEPNERHRLVVMRSLDASAPYIGNFMPPETMTEEAAEPASSASERERESKEAAQ